jgi:DNA modification methylase
LTVIQGDCLEVMPTLPADSVDAIITDPPYGLSFMGKHWDHGVPGVEFWKAAIRVAKPGSYLLAFGGTRTYHRLACAIEDAGFEIQDCLSWLYGSGFPKHKSKLKPAWEPIIMARKPAPKATLLNIDACRIDTADNLDGGRSFAAWREKEGRTDVPVFTPRELPSGRWPANVVLDEVAAGMLDEQSGTRKSGGPRGGQRGNGHPTNSGTEGWGSIALSVGVTHGDTGGASRFFYTAKASRSERNAGLEGFEAKPSAEHHRMSDFPDPRMDRPQLRLPAANHHPTVKPIALMRWLVRLVTPEGGTVLDPFTGSGTTGCAAVLEGRRFIGIEREAEYVAIANARIAHHTPEPDIFTATVTCAA